MLCNVVPYPPHGGVHTRVYNLVQRIARHHDVTLGCHAWNDADIDGAQWLTRNGIRTITASLKGANWRHAAPMLQKLMTGQPPETAQFEAAGLHALVARERFDVLQVEETLLAGYVTSLPRSAATKRVITFHNIHFEQEARIAALEPDRGLQVWRRANARMMRRYEPAIAACFHRRITVSQRDKDLLLAANPDLDIDVLPNGVDTTALAMLAPPATRRSIVFVGTLNYRPCIDAVLWLINAIVPIVRHQHPDLEVLIVGKQPPAEIRALAGPGIFVTGYVADVTPFYLRAAVAVVPIRAGGGSRLKILEAMALGRPVVSTTIGAEGLDVTPGLDIVFADDADTFAAAISRLLAEEEECRALAGFARQLVSESYDWEAIAAGQLQIYDEVMARPAPASAALNAR
jgi:glycosyltransferase involved in cell wall biosynthesis